MSKAIKLMLVAQITLGIAVIMLAWSNILRDETIMTLRLKITCLERGMIYIGNELGACAIPPTKEEK